MFKPSNRTSFDERGYHTIYCFLENNITSFKNAF